MTQSFLTKSTLRKIMQLLLKTQHLHITRKLLTSQWLGENAVTAWLTKMRTCFHNPSEFTSAVWKDNSYNKKKKNSLDRQFAKWLSGTTICKMIDVWNNKLPKKLSGTTIYKKKKLARTTTYKQKLFRTTIYKTMSRPICLRVQGARNVSLLLLEK